MMDGFWLSDRAWAAIRPLLPDNLPGARRVDDRRVISGIIDGLKSGCRWKDRPRQYGPPTTIYNRFNRWSRRGIWGRIFADLVAKAEIPQELSIVSTAVRARLGAWRKRGVKIQALHCRQGIRRMPERGRSRGGPTTKIHALTDACGRFAAFRLTPGNVADISAAPGLLATMPAPRRLLGDRGHDANSLRTALAAAGTEAVIPSTRSRKRPIPHDARACRAQNLIERAFCSLKDWRRIATRGTTSLPETSCQPSQ